MKSSIFSLVVLSGALLGACASAPTPVPPRANAQLALAVPGNAAGDAASDMTSCSDLAGDARPSAILGRPGAVASVSNLSGKDFIGARTWAEKPTGARIVVRATPGLTVPWLERVMSCRTANDGALGVEGAEVAVHAVGGGFAIDVTAKGRDAAREIQTRAQALAPR